jgi:hypothetical protein
MDANEDQAQEMVDLKYTKHKEVDDPDDKKDEDKELVNNIADDPDDKKEDYMKNLYVNDNFETGKSFIMIKSVDTLSNIIDS